MLRHELQRLPDVLIPVIPIVGAGVLGVFVGDAQLEAELAECNLPEVFKKKALQN